MLRSLINKIIRIPFGLRWYLIKDKSSSVYKYQKQFLLDMLDDAKDSTYGKKYKFSWIDSMKKYKRSVPLVQYEDIQPYIEICMKWASNVLTSYHIPRFTQSAWTTWNCAKYIPVTYQSLKENHFQCSKDFLTRYINNNPTSKLFEWKWVVLAWGFGKNDYTWVKNIWYISSILSSERPKWFSYFMALWNDFLTLENRESKLEYISENHNDSSISSISWVWPWIVQLWRHLEKKYEKSIDQIRPDLEVILSGWVCLDLYIDQYRKIFGDSVYIYNMYNGSEWFYGFQISNNSHELLLATHHAIYYEFIPMSSYKWTQSKEVLNISQIKKWVEYALVITTNTWLRRYIVWDTVRFSSLKPHLFQVTWRTTYYINQFREQVYTHHITNALVQACEKTGAIVKEYTVGPLKISETHWAHEWIIEFEKKPQSHESFIKYIDVYMQENAYHYGTKRRNNVLMYPPVVHSVRSWTFEKRMEENWKLWWQFKVPNVWNTRKYLNQLQEYL